MIFSSIEFLLWFLPIFLILYGITPAKYRNITLLTGSLIFYAMGDARYLALLLLSVLCNYYLGLHLQKRRSLLFLAVAGNIGVLLFFKDGALLFGDRLGGLQLPLGISFYTFQILSYLIDVYRGDVVKEHSLIRFATYVTMFPQLISGPIVSYSEVEKELKYRSFTAKGLQSGMQVFILGLAAKVLLADRIGILWHEVQVTGVESISTPLAWLAAIAYSMKIYFDFYGYSLMAVGLGRMLGFELPMNFHRPYMARSVRDFYRRWHITLGRWFCRYVYIPLGGSRCSELRTVGNLLVVWVLTAIWHGTTWNFFIWGGLLWLCIVVERQVQKLPFAGELRVLPHLYLWLVIPVSWVCFAITDIGQLGVYLTKLFCLSGGISSGYVDFTRALSNYGGLLLMCGLACTPVLEKLYRRGRDTLPVKLLLAAVFWFCVWRLMVEGNNPFLYFRF